MFDCKIPDIKAEALDESIKQSYKNSPDKLTEMEARVKRLRNVMDWQSGISTPYQRSAPNVQTARDIVWKRMEQTMNKVGLENVRPGRNVKSNIYKFMQTMNRKSKGFVDEAIANLELEQTLTRVDRKLNAIANAHNLNAHQRGIMKTMGTEVGWQPFIVDYSSVSSNGLKYLQSEQVRYIKKLQEFGLHDADIDQVLKLTAEPVQVFHEALMIAKQAGVDVGDIKASGMGYFPHIYSEDYLQRMRWAKEADGNYKLGDGQKINVEDAFTESRKTNVFVVEDEIILDHLLTKYGGADVYKQMSDRIGRKVTGVADMFDTDMVLDDAIKNVLPEGTVNHLVESGVMSKLPMTSDRVFNKLTEAYKLPYDGINQLMAVDYKKAFTLYKKQLEELAIDSNYTYGMVRGATEQGWGVTESVIRANPGDYRGWRSLDNVIPDSLQEKFLLKNDGYDAQVLSNTYVHPDVAQMINAELKVASSPALLGLLGTGLSHLNKWQSTMMLATTSFSGKQYVSNFLQLVTAGGNPFTMIEDTMRRTASIFTRKDMLQMLDNKKLMFRVDGEDLTERQLYTKLLGSGYINDYTQAAVTASTGKYIPKESIIAQTKRTTNQLKATITQYPGHFGKVGQELYRYADEFVNGKGGAAARFANVEFENLAKLALAKTAFNKRKVAGWVTGSPDIYNVKNLDDLTEYSKRYFYLYDEAVFGGTKLEGAMKASQTVVPFLNYRMKNMQGTLQQVIRHPIKYANYYKAYTHFNDRMENEDLPAGGVPDWAFEGFPVFWKVDKEDSGLEQDAYFYYPLGQLVQWMGGISDMKEFAELFMGDDPRLKADDDPNKKPDNFVQRVMKEFSFGWGKVIYGAVTGKSALTDKDIEYPGQKPQSFLGVEVSPWTKYMLENMLPPAARLDKWNPNGVFGQMERYDDYTGELIPAQDSWAGVPRNHTDNEDRSPFKEDSLLETAASVTGLKPNFINVAMGMGITQSEIKRSLYEGRSVLRAQDKAAKEETNPERKAELQREATSTRNYLYTLEVEQAKVDKYIEDHGFTTKQALKQLKANGNFRTEDLPDITREEKQRIRKELSDKNNAALQQKLNRL